MKVFRDFDNKVISMNWFTDSDNLIRSRDFEYFKNNYHCDLTDGVRIQFDDGWGLIRQSNTQPVIVCRFESVNKSTLDNIQSIIFTKLKEFGNTDVNI